MKATGAKAPPEWSIQGVARLAGTTSRTLRYYDDIGLLKPSRVGSKGYRYYDGTALLQLQRILLLRELGLDLPAIAEVFHQQTDAVIALGRHLERLAKEQERLARQMASVRQTIESHPSKAGTSRATSSGWPTCTLRMPASQPTTAANRGRGSCVAPCGSTRKSTFRTGRFWGDGSAGQPRRFLSTTAAPAKAAAVMRLRRAVRRRPCHPPVTDAFRIDSDASWRLPANSGAGCPRSSWVVST